MRHPRGNVEFADRRRGPGHFENDNDVGFRRHLGASRGYWDQYSGPRGRQPLQQRQRTDSLPRFEDGVPLNFDRRRMDISTDRERSREREKKRRKAQAECIRRLGGYHKLAIDEGKEPVRLFWDGFQWVAKGDPSTKVASPDGNGATANPPDDPLLINTTRKLRRLYFGNLPIGQGLTETMFQQMLFQEMRKRGMCSHADENPVLCVWFCKDKGSRYGFVEFATVEETERALSMDGMECLGLQIKVSRPNDYVVAATSLQPQHTQTLAVMGGQAAALLNFDVEALRRLTSVIS